MDEQTYRCEACNGIMVFDPVSQKLKCQNCDHTVEIVNQPSSIVEHRLTIDTMRQRKVKEKTTQTMECTGCGARIEIGGNETAAKCPYCDSTYVLASKQEETLVPDAVLPFKIEKQELGRIFATWIKGKWLAPNDLKRLYQRDSFQSIYAPYWTFDADADAPYSAMGGKDRRVKDKEGNERTVTDWYPVRGRIHHFFDDITTPASVRFDQGLFSGLEPFDFKAMKSYSPDYFSGSLSENYSISLEEGHKVAIRTMNERLYSMATSEVLRRYDHVKDVRMSQSYDKETYKYVMLPIYSTAYQFKGKTYTVLINGDSGKVKGEYPKSKAKIALIIIGIIVLLILLRLLMGLGRGNRNEYGQIQQPGYECEITADSGYESEITAVDQGTSYALEMIDYDLAADRY